MILHETTEVIKSADEALELLKAGNSRFVENRLSDKSDYKSYREVLNDGQNPFAIVICCSDSRVSPEIFFDQKLGDIFVIRNAGNVVDDTALGSLEYAIAKLNSPLIVVCGHSGCGAVTAAFEDNGDSLPYNLQTVIDRIKPAKQDCKDVDELIHCNIDFMVKTVKKDNVVKKFNTKVVGAYYNILTDVVVWT